MVTYEGLTLIPQIRKNMLMRFSYINKISLFNL